MYRLTTYLLFNVPIIKIYEAFGSPRRYNNLSKALTEFRCEQD